MPERICCNTESLPFKLLRSARVAALRLTDPERHGTIVAVREAGRIATLLASGSNRRAVAAAEASVYTQLQRALKGRTRLSRNSILPLAAEIFIHTKEVILASHTLRRPSQAAGLLAELLRGAAAALYCLELQLGAASLQGVRTYREKFRACELRLREELRAARAQTLAMDDHAACLAAATALTAFEKLLAAVAGTSYAASRRALRRKGHGAA
jgi:hypothetical protein